jgi:N-acetylmuramoyl-L-alanine amidase
MPSTYVVQQGDCLASIASAYGFSNWRTIYDYPQNADFRALRPNPNVLFPGDTLVIPDKTPSPFETRTGQAFTFVLKREATLLRLRFPDAGASRYRLEVDGAPAQSASLEAGAVLAVEIPPGATRGSLVIWPSDFDSAEEAGDAAQEWTLKIGALDPPTENTGIQARLRNLGYDVGTIDGIIGPRTTEAIKAFQSDHPPLKVDGICGPKTTEALVTTYGT